MALFPAFAGVVSDKIDDSCKDWLNNKSFQADDTVSLNHRALQQVQQSHNKDDSSPYRAVTSEEGADDKLPKKRKKKKERRKKKKKHKKRGRSSSDCSDSDSQTIYPSDLKRKEETDSRQAAPLSSLFSWLDDVQSSTELPFCVDRKPDAANWTYKSLYRGDIARYRRKGRSSLGLDPRIQEVSWEESEPSGKKKAADKKKKAAERYYSSASRQLLRPECALPALPGKPECGDVIVNTAFLPLVNQEVAGRGETGERGPTSEANPLGVYDTSTALWLQGKGKPESTGDQDQVMQVEQRASGPAAKTQDFNRHLREQPGDTRLWMDFIRYQDEQSAAAFGGELEQQGNATEHRKASLRAILEKKLSIAERAVAANPACVALQLERLRLCSELWEPAALAKEWKKLVFLHPNSAPLWRRYLLFTQSHFSTFTVSKVNTAYGKCLSTLSAVQDGSMVSHAALPGTEEEMLDIFNQQCHFLRQCGHSEKAVSLFQALIDFTFFKPDSVQGLSTKQQVEFFEPFWDSGEARVGEAGARGWRAWMQQQERGGWLQPDAEDDDEEEEEEDEVRDPSRPRWDIWLDVEASREAAHWLPWRPDKTKGQSVEDCEDPDRQVLFDDIGPSLIRLCSTELQLRLLLCFLSFMGLPVGPIHRGSPSQDSLLLEGLSLLTQDYDPLRPLTNHDLPDAGVSSVGDMAPLQGGRNWAGLGKQGEVFLANVLNKLLPLLPTRHRALLTLTWIRHEKRKVLLRLRGSSVKRLRSQGKSSKRLAKRLLKEQENRSSLELWREYAHLEWLLGNADDARKVFSTGMGGAKGPSSDPALCELCLLWAELELELELQHGAGQSDPTASLAMGVLTRLAEGTSSSASYSSSTLSPVAILKARKSYEQALTESLAALDKEVQKCLADKKDLLGDKLRLRGLVGCYALFQYLTINIQAADGVYSQAREQMESLCSALTRDSTKDANASEEASRVCTARLAVECEALAVQHTTLLRLHTSTRVFPLATLRRTLTAALSMWHHSAPLWSIYIQVENRYHSAGRARRFFHSVTRESDSVLPRLFAIVGEQQRKQLVDSVQRSVSGDSALPVLPENGLSHRIRSLFESAAAGESGAHCPLLWRMYMRFLVSLGNSDKARGIFYKALQSVPWAKGLYMDAVQLFPEKLQEFTDLMTEKELRLRLPLEELDILLED